MTQVLFDLSFRDRDKALRNRHGQLWTEYQEKKLREYAKQAKSLEELCDLMERSAISIIKRLEILNLLEEKHGEYFITIDNQPIEKPMSAPFIETKIFINGTDGSTMSDNQILKLILAKEAEVESWIRMKERPVKLLGHLADLNDQIKALSKYLDERK